MHPNEELVRKGFQAFAEGDMVTLDQLFADDAVWHSAGNLPFSGDHVGKAAIFESFGKVRELSDSFTQDIHSVLADDEHAVAQTKVHVARGDRMLDANQVIVFHVRDGKVTEAWVAAYDQATAEAFWN